MFGMPRRTRPRPGRSPRSPRHDCRCRNPFGELGGKVAEVVLDVRALSLEAQIAETLAAMEALPAGRRLRHVGTLVVWPLLAMLETRGYRYRLVGRRADGVHMLVWSLAGETG